MKTDEKKLMIRRPVDEYIQANVLDENQQERISEIDA